MAGPAGTVVECRDPGDLIEDRGVGDRTQAGERENPSGDLLVRPSNDLHQAIVLVDAEAIASLRHRQFHRETEFFGYSVAGRRDLVPSVLEVILRRPTADPVHPTNVRKAVVEIASMKLADK